MHTSSTIHFGRPRVLISATLCSLFLAACGGGGGGNGGTGVTSEQQTALAAKTAAGTAQFAQSFAQSQTESSDETGGGTSAQTSGQAITQDTTDQNCTSQGRLMAYDNSGGSNDTNLNIGDAEFPEPPFTGTVTESEGTVDYYQTRSDCVEDGFVIDGSADVSVLQVDTGETALAYRAGGFQGYLPGDGVDTDGSLDIEFSLSGLTSDISFRGVIHACNGCVDADLDAFGGTTDLDTAASAWLEMSLDFGEGQSVFVLGNGVDDRFTLVSSAQATNTAAVDVSGRLAVDNPGDECDFDVTYATNESVVIENFDTTGNQITTDGNLDITNNSTGDTFNVTYDSDGNVYVDGERVDVSDQEDACMLSTEEA